MFAPVIVNKVKSFESVLFETLICPLIIDVESSIVRKKDCMSILLMSVSLINIVEDDSNEALLNCKFPAPGLLSVTSVLNV